MWLGVGCSDGNAKEAERPAGCVRTRQESEPSYDRCSASCERHGQHKPGRGKAGQEGGDVTTMTGAQRASGMPETAAHDAEASRTVAGAEASVWTERMLSALENGVVVAKHASGMTVANGSV